ncbi:methyltransferase domain-containing protein [Chryseolinea sp. T2]|uniref:class I SAM-dependent methyltransferase n=1 Tax=Chryseolinea sp. T2 TaxID=3129255 RepID=UPI0030771CE8
METAVRTPYQGVINIIRFNWHFYVIAGISVLLILMASVWAGDIMFWFLAVLAFCIITSTCVSLLVSYYVYDRSGLYEFDWLHRFGKNEIQTIVNVHAGFDETSWILTKNFPSAQLRVFDFYDPSKHTEVSIERARKAYPPYDGTVKILTSQLPLPDESVSLLFNIFALHEVRNPDERTRFLQEQVRALRHDGKVVVVEHLRDVVNFLAYNIGFLHFLSEKEWTRNFKQAGLCVDSRFNITPFIHVFILTKADGTTH